jgi:hypothetical protein
MARASAHKVRVIDLDKQQKERALNADTRGPTAERVGLSEGFFQVGDDRKGGRVYTFLDSSLSRIYSRLVKAAGKNHGEVDHLRVEYAALSWYQTIWELAGREVSYGAMDLNSVHSSDPTKRCGMPMADRLIDAGKQLQKAKDLLGHRPGIVVDNIVCAGWSLEVAGKALGWPNKVQAISAAQEILRDAGARLAKHRGIG